ncbi:MAG: hypothetical protein LBQ94_03130 [Treponema sp.]|jgi:hypothetical protein|nr:hypothetical protein [Treponema sp.]
MREYNFLSKNLTTENTEGHEKEFTTEGAEGKHGGHGGSKKNFFFSSVKLRAVRRTAGLRGFVFCGFLLLLTIPLFSSPLSSPSWGFSLDLPEDYVYTGGDGRDRFSFANADGAQFDLVVYAAGLSASYASVEEMAKDVASRLNNSGEMDPFVYRDKNAYLLELSFMLGNSRMAGWALCLELGAANMPTALPTAPGNARSGQTANSTRAKPLLLAMAYGPAARTHLQQLHLSALDSIAPEEADKRAPGPITEYIYPREKRTQARIFDIGASAMIFEDDAEAAQALVDREFSVLSLYAGSARWREAWTRYYRAIYRDSYERLADIAFQVERKLNVPSRENRDFAEQVLHWVQSFGYERDFEGSDFVNLVSAATEGRGDCDSRAMLWAIILSQANIPAAMMVSQHYSHAMGLADLPGAGARFVVDGQRLLVAETTAQVSIGLIGETVSETEHWLGISFE